MLWLVLLVAQNLDPYAAMREKMEQSVAAQRVSVRRQAAAVHGADAAAEPTFYTVPWHGTPQPAATVAGLEPVCDPVAPEMLGPIIRSAAEKNGLPEQLIRSVIRSESAGRPCAVSSAGAMGLMQLMPATAQTLGVANPFDAAENVDGGSRFLKGLLGRFGGDVSLALGAYNAGPARIDQYGGLPPYAETQNYVSGILAQLGGLPRIMLSNGDATQARGVE